MFTGIIEELGKVKRIERRADVSTFIIEAEKVLSDTKIGDSISVNGVCLTVVKKETSCLGFEVIPETLKVTNLGQLKAGEKVNLERSLKADGRISGHFVTGHIDCMGLVRRKTYRSGNLAFEISLPQQFWKYILLKGSIAVDGVSLTVMEKKSNTFTVYIIPYTLKNTVFNFRQPADKVNIEFDILTKAASVA
ncbi:MAG: riboflavin synthase [Candidatus Omnitrophica bacterium]|nr:riboflavin synthase [Candidatus Omnitrophota bacterium]